AIKMDAFPTTYDARDRIWSGSKRSPIYSEETSLGRVIFKTMRTFPKNVCQIDDVDGVSVTFDQGISWAIRMAQHFKKRGLKHSDVIGIIARNTTYVMPLGVACLLNATPFHAVNPTMDEATTNHVFSITKPSLIFCDGQDYQKVRAATIGWQPEIFTITEPLPGVPHIETLLDPTPTEFFYQPEPLKEGGDQTVVILCSSGTTGLPKAVCISNHFMLLDTVPSTSEMVIYTPSGLDWMTGLVTFVYNTISGCKRIVSNEPFSPEYFVELVKKYKLHAGVLAPRHLSALASYPEATPEVMASLINIHYTGGWVSEATLSKIQEICPNAMLTCGYGMTEAGIVTAKIGFGHIVSAGTPVPGVRFRIVSEEGANLTYDQVGEIYVHTNRHWNGYYGNEVETRNLQDSEGWFHTGDLGYFDKDNYLYIVDRKKEMLRYESLSYFPTEIESVISQLPQVQDVCVVGIYDERVGDEAGALVVRTPGAELTAQDIVNYVAKNLPSVERQLHAGVQFTDKLPTNVNGKTLRKAAREEFAAKKRAG
ncbi:hypothetical protein KR067_005750, partial [Drosophila pandora]